MKNARGQQPKRAARVRRQWVRWWSRRWGLLRGSLPGGLEGTLALGTRKGQRQKCSMCAKNQHFFSIRVSQKCRVVSKCQGPKTPPKSGLRICPGFCFGKAGDVRLLGRQMCPLFAFFWKKPVALGGSRVLAVGKFLGVSTAATQPCGACQHGRNVHEVVATTSKRIGAAAARSSKAALHGRGGKG